MSSRSSIRSWREILIENSLDAIVGIDIDSNILDWNTQAEIIFGRKKVDVLGKRLMELIIPPEFRNAHEMGMKKYLETGVGPILNRRLELQALHSSGRVFPIELSVSPIQEEGKILFYSSIRDITLLKMQQQQTENYMGQLEGSEAEIRQIINISPAFISYIDKDERYKFVNRKYEEVFNLKSSEIEGRQVKDLIGEKAYARYRPMYEKAFQGVTSTIDTPIFNHKGEELFIEVQFVPYWKKDKVEGIVVIAHDITERLMREKDQELLANLSTVYIEITTEDQLALKSMKLIHLRMRTTGAWLAELHLNDGETEILHELQQGTPLKGKRIPISSFGKAIQEAHARGEFVVVNDVNTDSRTRENADSFKPMKVGSYLTAPFLRGGRLNAIFSIAHDHPHAWTRQEMILFRTVAESLWSSIENFRLMSELKEAVKARDEFISICSHELKTPVTSMKLQFQMAERMIKKQDPRVFSKESIGRRISVSNFQLNRMSKLIDDMLDVSKMSSGKLEMNLQEINLKELIQNVLESFQEQFQEVGIKVDFQVETNLVVLGDSYRMEQVLTNLLTNAMKYGEGHPIGIILVRDNDRVVIKVTDYGMGIPKEHKERIFQRYERAISASHISGLGLGLYITSQIVEAHRGSIRVDSQQGKGSTFIVELPLLH